MLSIVLKVSFAALIGMIWYHLTYSQNQSLFFFIISATALIVAPYKIELKRQREEGVKQILGNQSIKTMVERHRNEQREAKKEMERQRRMKAKEDFERTIKRKIV